MVIDVDMAGRMACCGCMLKDAGLEKMDRILFWEMTINRRLKKWDWRQHERWKNAVCPEYRKYVSAQGRRKR